MKDILRNKMPEAYYVKIAEMNILEMLQKYQKSGKNVILLRSHSSIRDNDT